VNKNKLEKRLTEFRDEKGFKGKGQLAVASKFGFKARKNCANIVSQAISYIQLQLDDIDARRDCLGIRVFIGHGSSLAWLELKNFTRDRLNLPWDEFNRAPVAGETTIESLSEMLDSAKIAFLVMTADDITADGRVRVRMNVAREAGLFQGRLGFKRAIIVLEDGCEEFSNIQGLGQIRFPKGKIDSAFEDIRKALEREGLIS
jgi:predicted nucleotide-binding protein